MVCKILSLLRGIGLLLTAGCLFSFYSELESGQHGFLTDMSHILTPEDQENLHFYEALYSKNQIFFEKEQLTGQIPKIIHFIWLGPSEFPEESLKNLDAWMKIYPDWEFNFWTDLDRPPPHKKMVKRLVANLHFRKLEECFYLSDNYGEKAQILSYEILFQEGGVYAEHDVFLLKNLNPIHERVDFYCGLEIPGPTILSSSVMPSPHLFACKAGHPILRASMDWIQEHWSYFSEQYPGSEESAVINRAAHRTLCALEAAIKMKADDSDYRNVILPPLVLNGLEKNASCYALHFHKGLWHKKNSETEKKISQALSEIRKKNTVNLLMVGTALILNVSTLIYFFVVILKMKKRLL